jgi:acetyl-CoA carboxylase biotin carboxylase subunit
LKTKYFKRLFIANRGEIAVRIIKACNALGLESVVGVSVADRESMAASMATRAVCIGPAAASASYLKLDSVVAAAIGSGCDAVHPGYGFLSERSAFQKKCADNNLIFVGPSASAIESMGDKLNARRIASMLGIPTVPGTDKVKDAHDALDFGRREGYPFMLKASAGGGGRGMRVVRTSHEVSGAFESASAEGLAAFGDATLFIERYIERARHVEIQIMADQYGKVVYLGERDCSTQRRHQKLIEEAPSPVIGDIVRQSMGEAAVRLANHVGYVNAGTVEFIVDIDTNEFYFLEVNTRIQVEHPVTEMVTGVDLVCEQINIASGVPLSFDQSNILTVGHAIECRINAENSSIGFAPSPGRLTTWQLPEGPGVRVDTHCYEGYFVPPYYDSMIAKLIAHGKYRQEAVDRMRSALDAFQVGGIDTTIPFHRAVIDHQDFRANRVTTRWVEEKFAR